jgi:excisionase family DNA binding protein
MMEDRLLDADETAASLHITKATLYKLVREGQVRAQKIGGKWKFERRDIEELFAAAGISAAWKNEDKKG